MEVCCSDRREAPEQRRTISEVSESQPNGQPVFADAIGVSEEPPNDMRENFEKYDGRLYGIGFKDTLGFPNCWANKRYL